jgi:Flp pilus assembly pilin Flp
MQVFRSLLADDGGAALTEYALVLSIIALGSMTALAGIAVACSATWSSTSSAMQAYSSGSPPP